tara:strand:+ start:1872 stop:2315 length:444 start_codon:yes stop_codon:yes gene_type:complete
MAVKSFRGRLGNNQTDTISLHTNKGEIGYRIVKFQTMPKVPENQNEEACLQIFTVESDAVTAASNGEVDFNKQTLLAASFYSSATGATASPEDYTVIFDNTIFNQDIFVASKSQSEVNYYIELEQMKLDLNESTVATLKDIRNIKSG